MTQTHSTRSDRNREADEYLANYLRSQKIYHMDNSKRKKMTVHVSSDDIIRVVSGDDGVIPDYISIMYNLRIVGRFRDTVVYFFGYMLQYPDSRLTNQEYKSMELIYNAIKQEKVHMYDILDVLSKIEKKNRLEQFRLLLVELEKKLSPNLACSAKLLISHIDSENTKFTALLNSVPGETDLLTDINEAAIVLTKSNISMELREYDTSSNLTEAVLGRAFAKLFELLNDNNVALSQPIYSTILAYIPNSDGDPIFQEYVRYISDIAWTKSIPSWNINDVDAHHFTDPYTLVSGVSDKLCSESTVPRYLKNALIYIKTKFLISRDENRVGHDAYQIIKEGVNIDKLLALINKREFDNTAMSLKRKLRKHIRKNRYRTEEVVDGMNRFGSIHPKELLLTFLTRLQMRLPKSKIEYRRVVTALMSIMLLKRHTYDDKTTITLWTLFDSSDHSRIGNKTLNLAALVLEELMEYVEFLDGSLQIPNKEQCGTPYNCFYAMLQEVLVILTQRGNSSKLVQKIQMLLSYIDEDTKMRQNYVSCSQESFQSHTKNIFNNETISDPSGETIRQGNVLPKYIDSEKPFIIEALNTSKYSTTPRRISISHPDIWKSKTLLSVLCLQRKTASWQDMNNLCMKQINNTIMQDLLIILRVINYHEIFAERKESGFYTSYSRLDKFLENMKDDPLQERLSKQMIDVYREYLQLITSYIVLPLITDHKNLNTRVILVKPISKEINNLKYHFTTYPADRIISDCIDTVPLVNPFILQEPVNKNEPFANLLAQLPANNPCEKKFKRLKSIFKTEQLCSYLDKCANISEYPDRLSLLISVMHQLSLQKEIQADFELYMLVQKYLEAVQQVPLSINLSDDYINEVIGRYIHSNNGQDVASTTNQPYRHNGIQRIMSTSETTVISNTATNSRPTDRVSRNLTDFVLPYWINPQKPIKVIISDSGEFRISPEPVSASNPDSSTYVILPSVVCLQQQPSAMEEADNKCEYEMDGTIIQEVKQILSNKYYERVLSKNWQSRFPTKMSQIDALLTKSQDYMAKNHPLIEHNATIYREALRFISAYIFLPLITDDAKLETQVILVRTNPDDSAKYSITNYPDKGVIDNCSNIVPVVNPVILQQPVNGNEPFSNLLVELPANHSCEIKFKRVTSIFRTKEVCSYLDHCPNISEYPDKLSLLITVLYQLSLQKEIQQDFELYMLIQKYLAAVQQVPISIKLSKDYIDEVIVRYNDSINAQNLASTTDKPHSNEDLQRTTSSSETEVISNTETNFSPTDKVSKNLTDFLLPYSMNPQNPIKVIRLDSGEFRISPEQVSTSNRDSSTYVILPSVVCLQQKPSAMGEAENNCEYEMDGTVIQEIKQILGDRYYEQVLGTNWQSRFPTKISQIDALLTKSQDYMANHHPLIEHNATIYREALRFISAYIFLPLIADNAKLETQVILLKTNSVDSAKYSITNYPDEGVIDNCSNIVPLVNPAILQQPINENEPFSNLVVQLPANDLCEMKFKRLTSILRSKEVCSYLDECLHFSEYPDKLSLLISVLYQLSVQKEIQEDFELYMLVQKYLEAVQQIPLSIKLSEDYINEVILRYNHSIDAQNIASPTDKPYSNKDLQRTTFPSETDGISNTKTNFSPTDKVSRNSTDFVLPYSMNPQNPIKVIRLDSGEFRISPEQDFTSNRDSSTYVVLPSVVCLQQPPSAMEEAENNCEYEMDGTVIQEIKQILGDRYYEEVLGKNWQSHFPTKISQIDALLTKSQDYMANNHPLIEHNATIYREALRFISAYIFLPLIADNAKLGTQVILLTTNSVNSAKYSITNYPDQGVIDNCSNIIPLVNPVILQQPINENEPFSNLVVQLPANDSCEIKFKRLTSIFRTKEVCSHLEKCPHFSEYPDKLSLLISVLYQLSVQKEIQEDFELYMLVQKYLEAVQQIPLSTKLSEDYINEVIVRYNHSINSQNIASLTDKPYSNEDLQRTTFSSETDVISNTETNFSPTDKVSRNSTDFVLPYSMNPQNPIKVIRLDSGEFRIFPDQDSTSNRDSSTYMFLPSVVCLQQQPSAMEEAENNCEYEIDGTVIQELKQILGDRYYEQVLGKNWQLRFPTKISQIDALITKSQDYMAKNHPLIEQNATIYREALRFISAYIFLPLIADNAKLKTQVILVKENSVDSAKYSITNYPDEGVIDNCSYIVPLVNPVILQQPINETKPFSNLVVQLPANDSCEMKFKRLTSIFRTKDVCSYLDECPHFSEYPDKLSLLISVLYQLSVQKKIQEDFELYMLVQKYLEAVQQIPLSIKLSEDYINEVILRYNHSIDAQNIASPTDKPYSNKDLQRTTFPSETDGISNTKTNFSPTDKVSRNSTDFVLPYSMNPQNPIKVIRLDSGEFRISPEQVSTSNRDSSTYVVLPSVVCLQQQPSAMEVAENNCEYEMDGTVIQEIKQILGDRYYEQVLGKNWQSRFPTKLSQIDAILTKSQDYMANHHPLIQHNASIYREALRFISAYIFLPLIADNAKLETQVILVKMNSVDSAKYSITNYPDEGVIDNCSYIVPLVNPVILQQPINENKPFSNLVVQLPANDSCEIKFKRLTSIFRTKEVCSYLDECPHFSEYPDKLSLLISVLYQLSVQKKIQEDFELYMLVQKYLEAVQQIPLSIKLSEDYINEVILRYNHSIDAQNIASPTDKPYSNKDLQRTTFPSETDGISNTKTNFSPTDKVSRNSTDFVLPYSMNPQNPIKVIRLDSGEFRISPEQVSTSNRDSSTYVVLPSVVCLQQQPSAMEVAENNCEYEMDGTVIQEIKQILGDRYYEQVLGKNWQSRFPTKLSQIDAILTKSQDYMANHHPLIQHNASIYREALRFISAYIFLPLIADNAKLETQVILVKMNSVDSAKYSITNYPDEGVIDNCSYIVPLVNPVILQQPINENKPFSNLVVQLPANDSCEIKFKRLTSIFRTKEVCSYLDECPHFSEYPDKLSLLISVLYQLSVQKKIQEDFELYMLVQKYLEAVQQIPLSIKLSEDYINEVILRYNHSIDAQNIASPTDKPYSNKDLQRTTFPSETDGISNTKTNFSPTDKVSRNSTDFVLPYSMNPQNPIKVIRLDSGEFRISPEQVSTSNRDSSTYVVLPSVVCLQQQPSAMEVAENNCEYEMDGTVIQEIKQILGDRYYEQVLGKNWQSRFPTKLSQIDAILTKSQDYMANHHPLIQHNASIYREALRFISAYIFLPLIADNAKLETQVILVKMNSVDSAKYSITNYPDEGVIDNCSYIVPLVNPVILQQPINENKPFSNLVVQLPANDSCEIKFKRLTSIFRTKEVCSYLNECPHFSEYPDKLSLLISILYQLSVQKKIQEDFYLYMLVQKYLEAVQQIPLSMKLSQDYINEVILRYNNSINAQNIASLTDKPYSYEDLQRTTFFSGTDVISNTKTNFSPNDKVSRNSIDFVLPYSMNPQNPIKVIRLDSGEFRISPEQVSTSNRDSSTYVVLPSVVCLQQQPSAMEEAENNCEYKMDGTVIQEIKQILGDRYYEQVLGKNWQSRFPTKLSQIDAILTKSQDYMANHHPLIQHNASIYREALRFISAYIFLPLIADNAKLETQVILVKTNSVDLANYSITNYPDKGVINNCSNIVPLVNPVILQQPINENEPFSNLVVQLPANDSCEMKFKRLTSIFRTKEVCSYLDKCPHFSEYRDKLSLLISVLYQLSVQKEIQEDFELYMLVQKYLEAVQQIPLSTKLSEDYINKVIVRYNHSINSQNIASLTDKPYSNEDLQRTTFSSETDVISNTETNFSPTDKVSRNSTDFVLPYSMNPQNPIKVIRLDSGEFRISPEQVFTSNRDTSTYMILPSIVCLQQQPSAMEEAENNCEYKMDGTVIQEIKQVLGDRYYEQVLGKNWESRFPTKISQIDAILTKSQDYMANHHPLIQHNASIYREALRFISAYIFLPLIADNAKLETQVILVKTNSVDLANYSITNYPDKGVIDNCSNIVPLVNPVILQQPINENEPFSNLVVQLPANDSCEMKFKRLTSIFRTKEVCSYLDKCPHFSEYPDKLSLLISVLYQLSVQKEIQEDFELYMLVQKYLEAVQQIPLSTKLSEDYINKVIVRYNLSINSQNIASLTDKPYSNEDLQRTTFSSETDVISNTETNFSPTDKVSRNSTDFVLPYSMNPQNPIKVIRLDSGEFRIFPDQDSTSNRDSSTYMFLPSVVCLQQQPSAMGEAEHNCEYEIDGTVIQVIKQILGDRYYEQVLGKNWQLRFPTKISQIDALITKSQGYMAKNHPLIEQNATIYRDALRFISAYIFLPLIADNAKLETQVILVKENSVDSAKYSITNYPDEGVIDNCSNIVPLVNPVILQQPINENEPFSNLVVQLPANDSCEMKFKRLTSIFRTKEVCSYLDKCPHFSEYPDKLSLLISVLYQLSVQKEIQEDFELYMLVQKYLEAVQQIPLSIKLSEDYINKVIVRYNRSINAQVIALTTDQPYRNEDIQRTTYSSEIDVILNTETNFSPTDKVSRNLTDFVLPYSMNPQNPIKVIRLDSGEFRISPEQVSTSNLDSLTYVILPSVVCLQQQPSAMGEAENNCEYEIHGSVIQDVKQILGDRYYELIMGEDWQSRFPTKISQIDALLTKSQDYMAKNHPLIEHNATIYREALRFISAYIFLPLIADNAKLETKVILVKTNSVNSAEYYITNYPHEGVIDNCSNIVPLVNPVILQQPINETESFSNLVVQLPANDSCEMKFKRLTLIFRTKEVCSYLDKCPHFSEYPDKLSLLISVLYKLSVQKEIQEDFELYMLVQKYLEAVQHVPLSMKLSQDYINEVIEKYNQLYNQRYIVRGLNLSSSTESLISSENNCYNNRSKSWVNYWIVSRSHLTTALPPPINCNATIFYITLSNWLRQKDLLQKLNIPLSSLNITNAEFLLMVINNALNSDIVEMTEREKIALEYCKDKVQNTGWGAQLIIEANIYTQIIDDNCV